MADINKNLKSICSFYASEWHLVTMLLPNLDQKINKGVKVTTILEKDLTKEMTENGLTLEEYDSAN